MATAFEDGGKNGGTWKDAESAIEYLLWSIRPKQTPEERQKLTAGIPALLKNINAWFDRIALPQDERKPFLDACFALQTAALRGRASEDGHPAPSPARPAPRAAEPARPRILEADGRQVLYHAEPAAPPGRESAGPLAIKIEDWLNYTLPDGKRLSGTCCWLDQQTQTALLFSPANRHAYALPKAAIAAQLTSGQARMLTGTALFDDAAKRALHQLRGG